MAEAQEPAPWVQLTVVQVDPASVDEFLVVQRELSDYWEAAGTAWRRVSRTAMFGDDYRFLIETPLLDFASLDPATEDEETEATAEPDALPALRRRVERFITGRQTYALRTVPEVDSPPPGDREPDLMILNVVRVSPGHEQEYLRLMAADFLPHFDTAGIPHTTAALTFGGEGGYIHVFHVEDFATLDKGSPVVAALGGEGAQDVTEKFRGIVTSSELWLARALPDVSF